MGAMIMRKFSEEGDVEKVSVEAGLTEYQNMVKQRRVADRCFDRALSLLRMPTSSHTSAFLLPRFLHATSLSPFLPFFLHPGPRTRQALIRCRPNRCPGRRSRPDGQRRAEEPSRIGGERGVRGTHPDCTESDKVNVCRPAASVSNACRI